MRAKLFIQRKRDGTQIEKPKAEEVDLYVDKDGNAQAFKGNDLLSSLAVARIQFISANGISLIGVEDPTGQRSKLFYQEWWCIPHENGLNDKSE